MNKKIIAVDIDGVLADWVGSAIPILNDILETNITIQDDVSFSLHEAFGVSKKRMENAIDELYDIITVKDLKPVIGSQDAISLLSKNFKIIAITARPSNFHQLTKEWVKDHFGDEIEVMLGRAQGNSIGAGLHLNPKVDICKSNKVICLVEDNPDEILGLRGTQTEPLCHMWPWNTQIIDYPEIPRGNWNYLKEYILEKYV